MLLFEIMNAALGYIGLLVLIRFRHILLQTPGRQPLFSL